MEQPISPMRLVDHLQEKQESFKIESYLEDRGYTRKSLYSEGSAGCFFRTRSRKNGFLKKRSSNVVKCLEIRNVFCKKLVSISEVMRLKRKSEAKEAISMGELESLSSARSSTEFSSRSEIRMEASTSMDGSHCHKQPTELDTDRMIQWRNLEEKKQGSPDSVLDEIEESPIYNGPKKQEEQPSTSSFNLPAKPTEESILSATLWELIIRREKPSNLMNDETRTEYINSKKALQQTRQLLFDCVREAVESEGRKKEMKMKTGRLMGPEKLGMIICDEMRIWNRQSVNRKKINQLLRSDFMGTIQDWDNFECFREDIVNEVGDEILEEIKDGLVEEVIDLYIW